MKKILAVFLSVALIAGLGIPSAAIGSYYSNEKVYLYPSDFEDSDGNSLNDHINNEYYAVTNGLSAASRQYVESIQIDGDEGLVVLTFKQGVKVSSDVHITGSITLREKELKERYTLTLLKDDLILKRPDTQEMEQSGSESKVFYLPSNYQSANVKFKTDDQNYGTFIADFDDDASFEVKIYNQPSLYLGYNTDDNMTLVRANPDAKLRFLTWASTPKFEMTGTMKIYAKSSERVYGVGKDNTLYSLGATYSTADEAYVFKTNTLGAYVVSDTTLKASAAVEEQPDAVIGGTPVTKNPNTGR